MSVINKQKLSNLSNSTLWKLLTTEARHDIQVVEISRNKIRDLTNNRAIKNYK